MGQKFCTKCGAPLRENAKFCIKCGTPVKFESEIENKNSCVASKPKTSVVDKSIKHSTESVNKNVKLDSHTSVKDNQKVEIEKTIVNSEKVSDQTINSSRIQKQGNMHDKHVNPYKTNTSLKESIGVSDETAIVIVLVVIAIISVLFYYNLNGKDSNIKANNPVKVTQQSAIRVSAEQLMGEYNKDPQSADTRYRGKNIIVTGTVKYIGDFNNDDKNKCFTIYDWRYEGESYRVLASVLKNKTDMINNIKVGDNVIVNGECSGVWKQSKDIYHVVGISSADIKKE